jgi:protein-S-isoprenylcysteine O-methyltransferase Ste14
VSLLGWGEECGLGSLIVRTVVGFLFLLVIMALCLFVPAGSLGYWQGWVLAARLREEEKLLRGGLPGYAEYCRRVRYRLVPGLW